jgi:hypothetical protein
MVGIPLFAVDTDHVGGAVEEYDSVTNVLHVITKVVRWVGGRDARGAGRVGVAVVGCGRWPFPGQTTTGRRGSEADVTFGGARRSAWKWIRRCYWIRVGAGEGDPIAVGGEEGDSGWEAWSWVWEAAPRRRGCDGGKGADSCD